MNRALILGIAIFLAVVGLALLSTGTGTSTAEAGHCGGCHGCYGGGCHGCFGGGLFRHGCHGCYGGHGCHGYNHCCGCGGYGGGYGGAVDGGGGPPHPNGKAPVPPAPDGGKKDGGKAERAPLGFRTVSFQR